MEKPVTSPTMNDETRAIVSLSFQLRDYMTTLPASRDDVLKALALIIGYENELVATEPYLALGLELQTLLKQIPEAPKTEPGGTDHVEG